jgi:hypothetical protein
MKYVPVKYIMTLIHQAMKTRQKNQDNNRPLNRVGINSICSPFTSRTSKFLVPSLLLVIAFSSLFARCTKQDEEVVVNEDQYILEQAISDEAQRNTIAFDGLGFMTGSLGSQTFLPPGKVADYSGFQYLRDNDPTKLGHNTDFVTIIAFNILNILTTDQINMFVAGAQNQIDLINEFGYKRFPLCKAFRRLMDGDLPVGTTGLNKSAVMAYTAELYRIDGQISYDRAKLFGEVIASLSTAQKAKLDALKKLNGIGNWDATLSNPLEKVNMQENLGVAVMTYASEIYAWYAGSVTSDVYFCPERHGTYFGSFYLKDWPAMGNPNYTIDEKMTADAGSNLLAILSTSQSDQIKGIVDLQRNALIELVQRRTDISNELRKFLAAKTADQSSVLTLSGRYGELDGELSYYYASNFARVYKSLTADQKTKVLSLGNNLGYINPTGAFLYSQPIVMPEIINTDFMFN